MTESELRPADLPQDEELHALQQGHLGGEPAAEQLPQVPAELRDLPPLPGPWGPHCHTLSSDGGERDSQPAYTAPFLAL